MILRPQEMHLRRGPVIAQDVGAHGRPPPVVRRVGERVRCVCAELVPRGEIVFLTRPLRSCQLWFLTQMYARFWNDLADHASA